MPKTRILIVEDEALTATLLRRELIALGYEPVAIAATAEEAIQMAGQHRPDLVLMDITLPGELDGIAAAVTIRGSVGAPVIFLTAHADQKTMERAVLAGPFAYLIKPFERADLQAAIQVALHKFQAEANRRQ